MTPRFSLPADREARQPPEWAGRSRDEVRLMTVTPDAVRHTLFRDLPGLLRPGDLVVVNTSGTLPARAGLP